MTASTVRDETTAALERIDGIADLHGMRDEHTQRWHVCVCRDGAHHEADRIMPAFDTHAQAVSEHCYTPDSHVVRVEGRVLVAPAVEVPSWTEEATA